MVRLDLQNLVLTWLDDINATYFTPAIVQVWLNNAQREVQKQLLQAGQQWYTTCAFTQTTQNQETYTLPSDYLKAQKFEIVTSGFGTTSECKQILSPCTLQEAEVYDAGTGVSQAYYILKSCLGLRPIPDNVYYLRLYYSYIVSDMTSDNAIPDVPTQYQEYIAVLATIDGFLRDQRDPSAFLEKKREYMELMKQDAQDRREDAPRSIVITQDNGWDYFF